ncbi:MAG: Ldh family oxidoreductase [Spirochaetales bacterium]|nr:MAG: Ldh family oxidoreductase [Spirochaetales bacterium]
MKFAERTLVQAAEQILVKLGESPDSAAIAASSLVQADMRGVSTHGINLLRLVDQRVRAGMLELPTRISSVSDDAATAMLDGNNGLGPVTAYRALDLALGKAREFGIGLVTLRNTNNIGALGCLTASAAARGAIAIIMTNGNPSVAPYGAAEPFFGTNPLSIGIPRRGNDPLVLDMSSSIVARGKIRLAALSGQGIPSGWALDEDGQPTDDPKRALKGCLLPLAGPKGSGLAMMIDILSGILSGSAYGRKLKSFHELEGATGVGAAFICVDIARFIGEDSFSSLIVEYTDQIKALRKQPGFDEILLPGELETKKAKDSMARGIEVPDAVASGIDEILARLGISVRLAGQER